MKIENKKEEIKNKTELFLNDFIKEFDLIPKPEFDNSKNLILHAHVYAEFMKLDFGELENTDVINYIGTMKDNVIDRITINYKYRGT